MTASQRTSGKTVSALRVRQWLREWEDVDFDEDEHRRRPEPEFYIFSLPASNLKLLSGIYRRTTSGGLQRSLDLGIQRRHEEGRSREIADFVRFGYPWSELSEAKRRSGKFGDLRKPGWLPTAIVVNILKAGDVRRGRQLAENDVIEVEDKGDAHAIVRLPSNFHGVGWNPTQLHPLEVIDGQHRLWAFEGQVGMGNFELPVVAFHGLDISWQAYLFWTINIRPKRINPSLAFDLYPLLRTEDWLERFSGHSIYRETRAQELTEALWAHPESPWHRRINMLGEPGQTGVSQAAWIRSLLATFVKPSEGRGVRIGGLFGAPVGSDQQALPWSGAQQVAFLIRAWQNIRDAIKSSRASWAVELRREESLLAREELNDLAFTGRHSLLNTDQGVRGVLHVMNDLSFLRVESLNLQKWVDERGASSIDTEAVSQTLRTLKRLPVAEFLTAIGGALAGYDWRTASAEGLSDSERTARLAFRGSGGYRELRRQLLHHLVRVPGDIGKTAKDVVRMTGL